MGQVKTPMGLAHCPNPGTAKKTGAGALSGLALFIFASEKYHDKVLVITYQIGFFHALNLEIQTHQIHSILKFPLYY